MEISLPESLQCSNLQLGHSSSANSSDEADFNTDDGSLWGGSDEELVDRKWRRIQKEFHTMGYREGIIVGKQDSAQAVFNIGFTQSALTVHNWGRVRGVTSAVACLPNGMMKRLVETQENRSKFQELLESVLSLSMKDVHKLFDRI
ncbi:hypothetical protein SLE2022_107040 [Rubroshorea leprosula]